MSVQAMVAVIEHSEAKLGGRLVLLVIANYEGETGAWPSIDRLSRHTRMSVRAVQGAIRQAEESGELHVEMNAGQRGTNRYWIHLGDHCERCALEHPQNLRGADSRRDSAPKPNELPTRGLQVVSNTRDGSSSQEPPTASEERSGSLALSDRVPYFLDRLRAQDEAWERVTPGAVVRIAKASSMDSVVTALSFASDHAPVLEGSAYGWLEATARGLEEAKRA